MMMMGSRGRRSWKLRLSAGVALFATLIGPLRMAAYAVPLDAPGGKLAGSGKLPTDTPWALPVRLRVGRISVLDGSVDVNAVRGLFDGRAASGLSTGGRPARFRVDLDSPAYLDALAIYGKADGALTVETDGPKGKTSLIQRASLATSRDGWNRREVTTSPLVNSVTITFEPTRADAMLRELELWGRPASAPAGDESALLPDALYTGVPRGARSLPASPAEQTIALSTVSGPGVGGTFAIDVDANPGDMDRAFLVYDLEGLPHFTAALRSINGQHSLGRFGVSRGAKGGLQVEEIDPAALHSGSNRIQFFPVDEHDPRSYRVRNLRVVYLLRAGTRLTDASARSWEALRDGREGTGWKADPAKPEQRRDWSFTAVTQPWALDVRLPAKGAGTLVVGSASGSNMGEFVVKLDGLSAGWHRVPLDHLPPSSRLTFRLTAGKELTASISELAVEGSPVPADEAPRLAVTYPLSGECVNHRVHVRGFVTPAGAETLYAAGARMSGAIAPDGSFGFELPEKDAAGRDLLVEAAYANGARARQAVSIGRCVDRPPVVVAGDGRPRQPVDDLGAPYGVTVKAGESATLSFDGVRLDIPAGAVEKDVRITIRPLPTKDVAPLDAGMTNVTPSAQSFRFGPLGMLFKKPVQMSVPYDDHLIPAGFDQNDVRTFYFDEAVHRWEQVGLVGQDERKMVAVSDHFTDFINATITTPEHPGPQSDNPTSLKDIKLADPSSGITQIQPPVPNSQGTANLQFPIEVPAGRRGVQPNLDLAYSNEGGNGWLGMGWDLKPSAIEIDTRFGVPSYQGAEVYMFDGEMLTTDPSGPGLYRRRAESSFEIIQRNGSGPTGYSWTVKDKNGTTFVFGSSPASRLTDPDSSRGFIFRWYLESATDVFGNRMTYSYVPDTDPNQQFTQMYLSEIDYTSNINTGQTASFQVKFNLDPAARADAFSSARSGFLVMTRRLLKSIDVDMNNALIRRYNLTYKNGLFNRPLLASVSMVGSDATTALYSYTFDYHNPFVFNGDVGVRNFFSPPVLWGQLSDLSGSNMSLRTENGLSSSDMEMKGLNASIGIDLGFFGFHISGGVAGGSDNRHMVPLDFNGDGLPDFVDDGAGINLNALPVTNVNPQRFSTLSSSAVSFFPPSGHTNRSGWNFGGGITVGNQVGGLGVDADYARTSAEDDRIMTDIDGDGYPDIVQINAGLGGSTLQVYQNQAGQAFLGLPPKTDIGQAAGRAASVADWNQQQTSGTFPVDPIIRWRAPFAATGKVTITGPIVKKKIGGDGIHASLWVAQGPQPSFNLHKLWEADVADPTISCTPSTTGDPCSGSTPPAVSNIQGGDRIYAIVDPKTDVKSDVVDWNPTITYDEFSANPGAVEPYGAPVYQFAQSPDFRVVGLPWKSWQANADGDLRLDMTLNKQPTSDDVTVQLVRLPSTGASGNATVPGTVVWSQLVQAADGLTGVQQPIPNVHNGDKFVLEVVSDTQIDPARLGITSATLRYTTFSRVVGNNKPPVSGILDYLVDPSTGQPVSAKIEGDTVTLPIDVVFRPITPHFPSHETLPLVTTKSFASPGGVLSIDGTVLNFAKGAVPAVVLIQGVNKLFKKYPVPIGGNVQTQFQTPSTNPGEPIFFTILSQTADVQPGASWSPTVNGQVAVVNTRYPDVLLHTQTSAGDPDSWAGGFHGWYVGDFDGSVAFNESLFTLPKYLFANHQSHDNFMFCVPQYQDPTGAPRQFFQCRGVGSYVQAGEILTFPFGFRDRRRRAAPVRPSRRHGRSECQRKWARLDSQRLRGPCDRRDEVDAGLHRHERRRIPGLRRERWHPLR